MSRLDELDVSFCPECNCNLCIKKKSLVLEYWPILLSIVKASEEVKNLSAISYFKTDTPFYRSLLDLQKTLTKLGIE